MTTPDNAAPAGPTLIYRPPTYFARLDLRGLFPITQPLVVELGSGDGSFLAEYAARHPELNFIGVERLLGRLRKLDRKGRRRGLQNLRLLRIEAAYCTEHLLPREAVTALHVYFPDPWPKKRHHKNRLVNEAFTEMARQALTPGGVIYLRTDDSDYFAQMERVFGANPAFDAVATPEELAGLTTDFERGFNARGIATRRAAYRRIR